MRITFRRFPDQSSAFSVIEADNGVVYRMREFTRAGTRLPHDLRHLVAERELGIADGIWGGIAAGMVYTSMEHVRGRRPPHSADRSQELKRAQRQRIMRAELFANLVEAIAMLDDPSAAEIRRLTQAARDAGVLIAAEQLTHTDTATSVRVRDGERLITDGPFMEIKDHLLGFYLVDVADLDAALEWAARMPAIPGATIEVRSAMSGLGWQKVLD